MLKKFIERAECYKSLYRNGAITSMEFIKSIERLDNMRTEMLLTNIIALPMDTKMFNVIQEMYDMVIIR